MLASQIYILAIQPERRTVVVHLFVCLFFLFVASYVRKFCNPSSNELFGCCMISVHLYVRPSIPTPLSPFVASYVRKFCNPSSNELFGCCMISVHLYVRPSIPTPLSPCIREQSPLKQGDLVNEG